MRLAALSRLVNTVKAVRSVLLALLLIVIGIPVAIYVVMSSDWAQSKLREIGERELSALLDTKVKIGEVNYSPFNQLKVSDVMVYDERDSVALSIGELDTRFELWDLIASRKIIIDYASISALRLSIYCDSLGAPLNIAPIIAHLAKEKADTAASVFKLRLNDVDLKSSAIDYDVLSEPLTPGRFNPSHIHISDLRLSAFAPVVSNDNCKVWLRQLSLMEQSGLELTSLTAKCFITPDALTVKDLTVELPNSRLAFGELHLGISGLESLPQALRGSMMHVALLSDSHVYLPDLQPFLPMLGELDYNLDVALDAECSLKQIRLSQLLISDYSNFITLSAQGDVRNYLDRDSIYLTDFAIDVRSDSVAIHDVLRAVPIADTRTSALLRALGNSQLNALVTGGVESGKLDITTRTHLADACVRGTYHRPGAPGAIDFSVEARADSLLLGVITGNPDFQSLSAELTAKGALRGKSFSGDVKAKIAHFYFRGHRYADIDAQATLSPKFQSADIELHDPLLSIKADAEAHISGNMKSAKANIEVENADLHQLNLISGLMGYSIGGNVSLEAMGESVDRMQAKVDATNLTITKEADKKFELKKLLLLADNLDDGDGEISISSDLINGNLQGRYRFTTIGRDVKEICSSVVPALLSRSEEERYEAQEGCDNDFTYSFTISDTESLCKVLDVPVSIIDKGRVTGKVDGCDKSLKATVNIPWLQQGSNVIEGTMMEVDVDGSQGEALMNLSSLIPTKKGDMDLFTTIMGSGGTLHADIDWKLIRTIPINGKIDFATEFSRSAHDDYMITNVVFEPGNINFGDEIWEITPSSIFIDRDRITVNNFALAAPSQRIRVNGIAGKADDDCLTIELDDIELINIFETLEIDKALISGKATGTVYGAGVLGSNPVLECECLKVKNIGYNYCTLGDADVKLSLKDGAQKFDFDAVITDEAKNVSYIDGYILPSTETLFLNIDANKVKVGFMKPFMSAFTSSVEGLASGNAELFGTFKEINLKGDIYAQDLRIKIDFTNTWYSASDSIHIVPGRINIDKIKLYDEYGNSAILDGWVAHEFFHNASFDFNVKGAKNFLCYDVGRKLSPDWYGRIFGNGTAQIKGKPGVVNIKANMSTAPHSTFSFVLSDRMDADEYSFITFRDVTPKDLRADSLARAQAVPEKVRKWRSRNSESETDIPTAYNMDIGVDINPDAEIVIVMDPIGGDSISSYGSGHMRMTYGSLDNDMRLYGTYTLERGQYNFTLQDIIIKDFIIKSGSSIYFPGDPYNAKLNIEAYYPVNANLSDLDESFLEDKELNRTNVPVRAILKATGPMVQPDLEFDLEFPTLSQDVYRKVRSIVSTEDMMNRQIIYLLALNRFYTPEYMASTTKGNELFSVVSSTLSSQLSSMLGKLSENWSIAPNLRSDRGDFSDVEVDVTLSSSLLNNRLLFNGNFGYRDKSLNTNQFIGDFDIEYLLNRSGEWRLKAYNRYNDQNYYLRTAQTTQGVGLQYRRDFDKTFRFLKYLRRKPSSTDTIRSLAPAPAPASADSVPLPEAAREPEKETESQKK